MAKCLGMERRKIKGTSEITDHPCGMCINCKINAAEEFKTKLIFELKNAKSAYFVKLGFDEEHFDSIDPSQYFYLYQKFMKALCMREKRRGNPNVRKGGAFEYGEKGGRPHFHPWIKDYTGGFQLIPQNRLAILRQLKKDIAELWPYESCTYVEELEQPGQVARYISKHTTNFIEEKGDILGIGIKPRRFSPKNLGQKGFTENLQEWNRASYERNYIPDPMCGYEKLRIPKEWRNLVYGRWAKEKQVQMMQKKEQEEFEKLTPEKQLTQKEDYRRQSYEYHEKRERRRQFRKGYK